MISIEPELIWQGRLQLGDEPGTYGDAAFVGLATEFPVTLRSSGSSDPDIVEFRLESDGVHIFGNYPGHKLTVFSYAETAQPFQWQQSTLQNALVKNNDFRINVDLTSIKPSNSANPIWISFEVEVDTSVPPGLYNDFVIRRLSMKSQNYKYTARFGFDYFP